MQFYLAHNLFTADIDDLFRHLVEPRLEPDENVEDVLAGGYAIASARASLAEREPFPLDAEFALSVWCWFPLKPDVPTDLRNQLIDARREIFSGFAEGNTELLSSALPESTLLLSHEALYRLQAGGHAESFLTLGSIGGITFA